MNSSILLQNFFLKSYPQRFGELRWIARTVSHSNVEVENSSTYCDEIDDRPNYFNKSGLLNQHRNLLKETVPYSEPQSWIHTSEKYQRKLFGRYGTGSGVNPRFCFKTKKDIDDLVEYNSVSELQSLGEMMEIAKKEREEKQEKVRKREDEITSKLQKLDLWKKELNAKIAKKEADTLMAKERKERLIEDVRRHFGFKVDPREDRFKEMLEQKEREDKKKQKEEKRKAKEEKIMNMIVQKPSVLS